MKAVCRSRILGSSFTALILIALLNRTSQCAESAGLDISKHPTRVVVPLNKFPDHFSNEKLPNPKIEADTCIQFIGCIARMPVYTQAQDLLKMATKFKISRRHKTTAIPFELVVNCVDDEKDCDVFPFNLRLLLESSFNPNLQTIIVTSGYRTDGFTDWQERMQEKWLQLENVNVILVAWPGGNFGYYDAAVANSKVVARQITVLLHYLAELNGQSLKLESFSSKIHLIGHSLGAHMSAYVGQDLSGQVDRITGLDPAGPDFVDFERNFKLDRSDAKLVVALHTNAGNKLSIRNPFYGIDEQVGHLDYYANDGKRQPQCDVDLLGCSHKAAVDYYITLLNNEVFISDYLDQAARKRHRLFAYASNSFDEFHDGTCLIEKCPVTLQDNTDLNSSDLDNCAVPIDFISSADSFRQELETEHNVNLEQKHRLYFFTSHLVPYLNNHNLIKIIISRSFKEPASIHCDLQVEVKMDHQVGIKYKFKDYKLLERENHLEISIPYLTPVMTSKYELADLDLHDFYVQDAESRKQLLKGLRLVLPSTVIVSGLVPGSKSSYLASNEQESPAEGTSLTEMLKKFFSTASSEKVTNTSIEHQERRKALQCNLHIKKILVQPLKKLSRYIVAAFTRSAESKSVPDLFILNDRNFTEYNLSHLDWKQLIDARQDDEGIICRENESENFKGFLDGVIIGVHESSITFNSTGNVMESSALLNKSNILFR